MELKSSAPEETINIGEKLGRILEPGDVVCLYGDIGAGKTTLIKGVASAFGIGGRDITSASFTIIAEYDTMPPFYHIDLYRLKGGEDVDETGIYDYLQQDGVAVIEWSERLDNIPERAIIIRINIKGEEKRIISIEGINEKDWDRL